MASKIEYFTQDAAVLRILKDLKDDNVHRRQFSDVISTTAAGEELQYVDLVQEGGGVLGVALLGYTFVLEQMGLRFLQLAGTSAGAINTMLMAASGPIEEQKTSWVLEQTNKKNFYEFVDGDGDARDFIDSLLSGAGKVKIALKGAQVIDNFRDDFGLNPGSNFYNWLKNLLAQKGISNLKDLRALRKREPDNGGLKLRQPRIDAGDKLTPGFHERVAIVAADITTQSKIIFPEMAELYWSAVDAVNPADFVRASMSIPFFFHPFRVKGIPQGPEAWARWNKHTGFQGNIPSEVLFIDGGIMSNFPINLFHDYSRIPVAPTFGVKLGIDRTDYNKNEKFFSMIGSIFDSARQVHDFDFIFRNPEYRKLICMIETGAHNWLNFGISDNDKLDLFIRGAKCAGEFLRRFDWEAYKKDRKMINYLHA